VQDLRRFQRLLQKYQNRNRLLELHEGESLTALPSTPAQLPGLEELLLHGVGSPSVASRIGNDLVASTSLVSVSLRHIEISSEQAAVVSALASLPNLEQLTWCCVQCHGQPFLSSSALLQKLAQLTALELGYFLSAALEHLGSLTRLVQLSIRDVGNLWIDPGCPGLEHLRSLTSLQLSWCYSPGDAIDIPSSIS